MTVDRSDVHEALGDMDYPAAKEVIVQHAEERGAADEVLRQLRDIPPRTYDEPASVIEELTDDLSG